MKNYYDSIAEGYDSLHGEEQLRKLSIIGQHIPKGALILDVGCGTGLSTILGNVIGIDPSRGLLKKARIPVVQGMGEHLPFKDGCVDAVICVTALHNFSDIEKGIKEMVRVSKGVIVVSLLRRSREYQTIRKVMGSVCRVDSIIEDSLDSIIVCNKKESGEKRQ